MSEKIDKILKKTLSDISTRNSDAASDAEQPEQTKARPAAESSRGSETCPICGGVGFVRLNVPLGHPQFGKLQTCTCRQSEVIQQVRGRLFSLSNLDQLSHLTFESFNARGHGGIGSTQAGSIEKAYESAQRYASNLKGWLVLKGSYGRGKTHLAAAIANFAVGLGVPTLFLTAPDMLDWLRSAYNDPDTTFEERFEQIRNVELLVLDDFGTQNLTAWAQEKLFQILNYRYINKKSLVLTTNLPLEEIEPRIRSRMLDSSLVTLVEINAPDYRQQGEDSGQHEISSARYIKRFTFQNFSLRDKEKLSTEERKSLKDAHLAAKNFGREPEGWLVLLGAHGTGKTHLAAAIHNLRSQFHSPPMFVVAPDLLDDLRATFDPNSNARYDRRFDDVRNVPLLVLDDLSTATTTQWAKEKLFQIINHRYNAELPTVITMTDYKDVDERILSRILDSRLCKILTLNVPPFWRGG